MLLAVMSAHELPAQSAPVVEPMLQPGDAVRIQVWGMGELSGEFNVDAAGRLFHPLYQTEVVAGIPLSEARQRLGSVVRQQNELARFTVQPLLRVGIEGEVGRPNIDRYPPETTIGQVVALAGGATDLGRLDRVRLVRGEQVTILDLRGPTEADLYIPIQSGDRIIVDRRRRIFSQYVLPAISVVGSVASLVNLITRGRRR